MTLFSLGLAITMTGCPRVFEASPPRNRMMMSEVEPGVLVMTTWIGLDGNLLLWA